MSGCNGCPSDENVTEVKTKSAHSGSNLVMTKEAADYVAELLKKEGQTESGLKIEVQPGGCAGYKYFMGFQKEADEGDKTFEFHGVKLFLSPESIELISGSTIEYTASLEASGLRVNNPNAVRTCGCGKSFG